jgi:ATP-dependent RNA helicase DDX3X
MMFSATFPKSAREMAREYMALDYMRIRVGRAGQAHENITQEVIEVTRQNKKQATYDVLFASKPARTLIFCNSKHEVDLLDDYLYNQGLPTTSIHGERDQREREDAIRSFRTGKAPILIATGVSARGLDIAGIAHVINYDLPRADHGGIQEYIHRIGRTARIGNRGTATSFYNDRDEGIAQDLVNILIECKQTVPAFLEHLKPEEGDTINFNDESDDEDADGGAGIDVDAAWGASDNGEAAPTEDTTMGFTPDAGSGAAAAAASDW